MAPRRRIPSARLIRALAFAVGALGCGGQPAAVPAHPTWADVAPVLRGECASCHGWTASDRLPNAAGVHPENTGGSVRLDFFDVTSDVCGDAALALDPTVSLAGSPVAITQIRTDIRPVNGARWARMPPQPSPALPAWELEMIERWVADPVKGPPPAGNRAPTVAVGQLPATANRELTFTVIIDDPDGDPVLGVVELGGVAFLMNRPGAFSATFDASAWPAGTVHPLAVVCDGWTNSLTDLGPIQIQH